MGSLWAGRMVAGMELWRGLLQRDIQRIFWEDRDARHDSQQAQMVLRLLGDPEVGIPSIRRDEIPTADPARERVSSFRLTLTTPTNRLIFFEFGTLSVVSQGARIDCSVFSRPYPAT